MHAGRWEDGWSCLLTFRNVNGVLQWQSPGVVGAFSLRAITSLVGLDHDLNGRMDLLALHDDDDYVQLFANNTPGTTLRFTDVGQEVGIHKGRAEGAVTVDFNQDGDEDLFLGRLRETGKFFYRSISIADKDALARTGVRVRLVGNGIDNNRFGTSAAVKFETTDALGESIVQTQMVDGGGGHGAQRQPALLFGTGDLARAAKATVRWPNGRVQVNSSIVTSTSVPLVNITEPTAAPSFVTGSLAFQYVPSPGGKAAWIFTWRTVDWSNPALDRVVVYDPPGQQQPCVLGTFELRDSQAEVTATVAPSSLGGYLHTLTWQTGHCAGYTGCSYKYKAYSKNGGLETVSAARSFTLGVCLE